MTLPGVIKHGVRLLLLSATLGACVAAVAAEGFEIAGSAWFNEGTETPSMCMRFLPNGTLVFEGGFLFYNPSHWNRSPEDPELIHIRLGGKERFPTLPFSEQLARPSTGGLVGLDEKKRLLTFRMASGRQPIEFMTFIFSPQERCVVGKRRQAKR